MIVPPKIVIPDGTINASDKYRKAQSAIAQVHRAIDLSPLHLREYQKTFEFDGFTVDVQSRRAPFGYFQDVAIVNVPALPQPEEEETYDAVLEGKPMVIVAAGFYVPPPNPLGLDMAYDDRRFYPLHYIIWDVEEDQLVFGPGNNAAINAFGVYFVPREVVPGGDGISVPRWDIDSEHSIYFGGSELVPMDLPLFKGKVMAGTIQHGGEIYYYHVERVYGNGGWLTPYPGECSLGLFPYCDGGWKPDYDYASNKSCSNGSQAVSNILNHDGATLYDLIGSAKETWSHVATMINCGYDSGGRIRPLDPLVGACWNCEGYYHSHQFDLYNAMSQLFGTWRLHAANLVGSYSSAHTKRLHHVDVYNEGEGPGFYGEMWGGFGGCGASFWRDVTTELSWEYASWCPLGKLVEWDAEHITKCGYVGVGYHWQVDLNETKYEDVASFVPVMKGAYNRDGFGAKGIVVQLYHLSYVTYALPLLGTSACTVSWDINNPEFSDRITKTLASLRQADDDPDEDPAYINPFEEVPHTVFQDAIDALVNHYYTAEGFSQKVVDSYLDLEIRIVMKPFIAQTAEEVEAAAEA